MSLWIVMKHIKFDEKDPVVAREQYDRPSHNEKMVLPDTNVMICWQSYFKHKSKGET